MRQSQQQPEQRTELESTKSELEVAHISGRRPAVVAAIVVVGVLVAMVWVGMSGRTNPKPAPSLPAVADVPTADPPATPAATPRATCCAPDVAPDPSTTPAVPADIYGASLQMGDAMSTIVLREVEPGHLFGRMRLTLPISESDGTFLFQHFSAQTVIGQPVPIADWPINLEALAADSPLFTAVNATLPARRTIPNASRPVERGYRLTVTGQRRGAEGELTVDVKIGPNRQLQGNDGILGWPVVYRLDPFADDPPERGPSGYCGPDTAPPAPGPNEPDCSAVTR